MVRRRFRAAGVTIPGLTCHGFRAGAATVLLGAGMELTRVQDLLGHADPRTTRLYDARSREAQMDILSRLSTLLTSPRCAPAPSDGDPSLDRE